MNGTDIELVSLSKSYGAVDVVKAIDLQIPTGKFVSILGPSGCGKTTTLNMIAGFSQPSSGDIRIRGKSQAGVPPERRNLGLVFQNYALFPHMTVTNNVAFGLKMRGAGRNEIETAVEAALKSVHLEGYGDRFPKALSGGQQQRVALARAIAPRPSVLLLDEPLSNLDLKLREAMRIELKEIQEALGMTFVYVTHDQEEAMSMSDKIVVMWQGAVAQEGAPATIYNEPSSSFVANFIGKSNIFPILERKLHSPDHQLVMLHELVELSASINPASQPCRFCCIRPENVKVLRAGEVVPSEFNRLKATLRRITNLGAYLELTIEVTPGFELTTLVRSTRSGELPPSGGVLSIAIEPANVQLLSH
jgi:ABC-type Fe3+/spermidine/putrescine transport system ATPase subunit